MLFVVVVVDVVVVDVVVGVVEVGSYLVKPCTKLDDVKNPNEETKKMH